MENRPIPTAPDFENLMTRGEMIAAAIYLPLHVLGVPIALNWLAGLVPAIAQMSNAELNILYYSVGLVYMLLLLRHIAGIARKFPVAVNAVQFEFPHRVHCRLNKGRKVFVRGSGPMSSCTAASGRNQYLQVGVIPFHLFNIVPISSKRIHINQVILYNAKCNI